MAEQGKKKIVPTSPSTEPATPGINPASVYVGGDTIADRLMPHVKKILVGVAVVAVLVSIFFGVRYFQRRKAERSTDAVIAAVTAQSRRVATPDDAPADADAGVPEETFSSRGERAEAALAALGKATGGPRQGVALLEADELFEAGKLDQAEAAYRKAAGRSGLEGALAREGLGFVAEARAQDAQGAARDAALQQALEAFRAVQTDDAGPRRAYALYHEARILALLGKKDEARTAFESAADKAKETGDRALEQMIDARLTQLDMPPLPPKPATAPPTTPPATPPASPTAPAPTPAETPHP